MISIEMLDLLEKWDGYTENFRANRIFTNRFHGKIFGYRDNQDNIHIIMECENSEFEKESRKGITVEIRSVDLIDDGVNISLNVLDFKCSSKGFKNNYVTILNEVLDSISETMSVEKATKMVIERWFHFLQLPRKLALDLGKIIGLIGELLSFEVFCAKGLSVRMCLDCWHGPSNEKRDYIFKNHEIEVKTATTQKGHLHTINGIDQLGKLINERIFIHSWNLLKDSSPSALSLSDLVERIEINFLPTEDLKQLFFNKLYEYGFDIRDKQLYNSDRYRIVGSIFTEVNDEFPKLTRESFASGIHSRILRIQYEIDLNGIPEFDLNSIIYEF